jgi:hypothetical protein
LSGDYTRFTFQPTKDFSGVLKQQGRVDLDADWNELIAIVDRRWRSETIDIVGHCVVPDTTPDAFLITPTATGRFSIGIGRMYIDGIQVENHGLPPDNYLADLGELRGTLPVPYDNQPYLPAPLPPALPGTADTTDLVYLDVWRREVTVLEDPSIREIALGGPDTTTRVQSVWQVRVLQDVGDHGCCDTIGAWDEATAPSAGRLTTSTVPPPASDDPCIISPTGGYRGLENRLYRVEIHSVGPIGGPAPAKFKWSRNNATIASAVTAIPSPSQITVQRTGRDQVLRFEIGNWVEITDDFREFQGLAGHMARVTVIDEANRILTFDPAIPGAISFDPTDASRHTRCRRWDQSLGVDANGLLDVAAGPIEVEDGIRVGFALDPANGSFHIGDYWVFAARTADGSVEALQAAPPRGILHHFCRLGFIRWGADVKGTTFTDCRPHWPPLCCEGGCTVTVGDGVDSHGQFTDIQQAINALGNRGGIVCIGRGFYTVTAGLVLDNTKRNVIIRGMGPATRIVFAPRGDKPGVFLRILRTEQVRLERVFVVASGAAALVRISESRFCRVADCVLVDLPPRAAGQGAAPRAIDLVGNVTGCEIVHNALLAVKAIAGTNGVVTGLSVRDNQALSTQAAVVLHEARGVEIVGNQFRGLTAGLFVGAPLPTRDTFDAFQAKVSAAFAAVPTLANFQATGVIIYTGNRVVISANLINAQVAVLGFLLIEARIERNDVLALAGVLLIHGVQVRIEDNFVLGLFAGLIQAGILAGLDCTANEWLGLHGIIWMAPGELLGGFGKLLGGALGAVGFAGTGPAAITQAVGTGTGLAGNIQAVGLAAVAKVHRNVFLTFLRGISKTDRVISADISIVDNTFSLCGSAGIALGDGGRGAALNTTVLASFISPRHLIQGNALSVRGRGIVTAVPLTLIEQNSVQCPAIAFEVDAPFCAVRNNLAVGQAAETPPGSGLVNLHYWARGGTVVGNRLLHAPGHSILIQDDIVDLAIDDNLIQGARAAGIGTRDDSVALRRTSISRNRVEGCRGDVPAGSLQVGGALAIGLGQDVRLIGNTFVANSPPTPGDAFLRWFAVYFDEVDGIEIAGKAVMDNATVPGLGGFLGAIGMQGAGGAIRVQDNVVHGNGGVALSLLKGGSTTDPAPVVLVQQNRFSDGPNPGPILIVVITDDALLFEGNQVSRSTAAQGPAPVVMLVMACGNVCGNRVENSGRGGMFVAGAELVVNANAVSAAGDSALRVIGSPIGPGPVRVIVTSNLTTGLVASSIGLLLRANNFPAP